MNYWNRVIISNSGILGTFWNSTDFLEYWELKLIILMEYYDGLLWIHYGSIGNIMDLLWNTWNVVDEPNNSHSRSTNYGIFGIFYGILPELTTGIKL